MLDWVCDKVEEVDRRHPPRHERALRRRPSSTGRRGREGVTVHDDGTLSNEDRLGAIGDIAFVLERTGIDDDLLVIAGDNLFDFALPSLAAFWEMKGAASAVAVYDCGDLELATHYGVVEVDGDDRLVGFEEKPSEPASTLVATATYLYHRDARPARRALPRRGQPARPARPARRLALPAEPVYGYRFDGRVVRHREPRAAARGGQPLAGAAGPAAAGRVLDAQLGGGGRLARWARLVRRPPLLPAAERPIGPTSSRPGWSGSFSPQRNGLFRGGCGGCGGCEPCAPKLHLCRTSVTDTCAGASYRVSMCCSTCSCRVAASSARVPGAIRLRRPARARCRGSPRRSAPAAARPSPGRSRAAASARAGGSRSPPPGPRSRTTRGVRTLVSAWKERGLRGLASLAAELVVEVVPTALRTTDHVRAARRRPEPRGAATTRRRASPASSAGAGSCRSSRVARAHAPAAAAARPRPRPSGGGTSAAPSGRRRCAGASCLVDDVYTTRLDGRPPRRRLCGPRAPPRSRWSRSRAPSGAEID